MIDEIYTRKRLVNVLFVSPVQGVEL